MVILGLEATSFGLHLAIKAVKRHGGSQVLIQEKTGLFQAQILRLPPGLRPCFELLALTLREAKPLANAFMMRCRSFCGW